MARGFSVWAGTAEGRTELQREDGSLVMSFHLLKPGLFQCCGPTDPFTCPKGSYQPQPPHRPLPAANPGMLTRLTKSW